MQQRQVVRVLRNPVISFGPQALRIGPRLWKTGLAVALTIFLVRLTGHPYEVFGAVAAALAVAPSATRSLRTMSSQILANLIGGLAGSLAVLLLGPSPLVIGGTVVLVLLLCQLLDWRELAPTAVTVTLFVMAPHSESVTTYTFWRLLSVLIGSVVGTAVNALILPPDYQAVTRQAIDRAGAALDRFIIAVTERLDQPHGLTKNEVLAGAARVDGLIAEARRLSLLMGESRRPGQDPQHEVIERAIKVLSSLLERIQVIHKAALTAERAAAYPEQLPEIQGALKELVLYRQELYRSLLTREGAERLPGLLGAMERQFESPVGVPVDSAQVEPFFRLYRMCSSVSYMANRLARLQVASQACFWPPVAGDQKQGCEEVAAG